MTDLDPLLLNIIYVATGGVMVLFFMWMGCKLFSHIVNFSIPDKLAEGKEPRGRKRRHADYACHFPRNSEEESALQGYHHAALEYRCRNLLRPSDVQALEKRERKHIAQGAPRICPR